MSSQWVVVGEYSSLLESSLGTGALESNDIPFLVKGPPAGIFGPGFSGPTAAGVQILVPDDRATEAQTILTDLLEG